MTDASADNQAPKVDVDSIHHTIRQRICFLEYPPGTHLKEAVLAAEFGVSRTPVREALNRLHHLGLIETRNGVGTVVVSLSPESISHIYELRLELASLIGKLSAEKICQRHIDTATQLLSSAKLLLGTSDTREYFRINHMLNFLIIDIIGNSSLKAIWEQLYSQAASTWYQVAEKAEHQVNSALVEELSDLVSALQQRDIEAVGLVQRIHIGYGFARIKRFLFDMPA